MNALILLCHYDTNSFNHAIANQARKKLEAQGYSILYHDIYKEEFNPILEQKEYEEQNMKNIHDPYIIECCNELQNADVIVVVHPNWWGQPPAMLKGWVDRVFRRGIAYKYSPEGKSIGLLNAKKAFVFNTSNTPEPVEMEVYGDPLDNLWTNCTFKMCGVEEVRRLAFRGVVKSDEKQRKKWLQDVTDIFDK